MSTLKAVNIQHPSSSTPAITLDSTGAMIGSFPQPFRNRIINGDMKVAQRPSATIAPGGTDRGGWGADRFFTTDYNWSAGTNPTVSRDTSIYPTGFRNSYKWQNGATPLTFASGGYQNIGHCIEGYNLIDIYSSNQVTLSFWVRSSTAGKYTVLFTNSGYGRMLQKTYTITSANVWQKVAIVIDLSAGTSSGSWDTTNGIGLKIDWMLGSHADRTGNSYLDTWGTPGSYHYATTDSVNLATIANSTFYLTGVQLEAGPVATPFEFKSYAQELRECQRYYQKFTTDNGDIAIRAASTDYCYDVRWLPVTMRSAPTATHNWQSGDQVSLLLWGGSQTSQIDFNGTSPNRVNWLFVFGSYTVGRIYSWSTSGRYVGLSAEL